MSVMAGCGGLDDDTDSDESGQEDPVDDQPDDDSIPTTVDDGESVNPGDDPGLSVFVFAENETEQRYYEEFTSDFVAETGISVDLEVRLP